MFVFLLNFCSAIVVVQKQASVYSNVQSGKHRVTHSDVHREDVTQIGADVKAYETHRKLISEATPEQAQTWHCLIKKVGTKRKQVDATRMIKAMGFGEQFPGQTENGWLNIVDDYNVSGPIADIEFNPNKPSQRYAGQIFCDDGRCQSAGDIT